MTRQSWTGSLDECPDPQLDFTFFSEKKNWRIFEEKYSNKCKITLCYSKKICEALKKRINNTEYLKQKKIGNRFNFGDKKNWNWVLVYLWDLTFEKF